MALSSDDVSQVYTVLSLVPEIVKNVSPACCSFRVIAVLRQFKTTHIERVFPCGTSIDQVRLQLGIPLNVKTIITMDGGVVLPDFYIDCEPYPNATVSIRVKPGIFAVALLPLIAGIAAGSAAAATGIIAVSTAIALGGMLGTLAAGLITLLTAPKPPRKLTASPQLFTISGDTNGLAPYAQVPYVLGRRKVTPTYYGFPFDDTFSNMQYVRIFSSAGYGPVDISDIRIKDTPVMEYHGIQVETRAGFPDDEPTTIWPGGIIDDQQFQILLEDSANNNVHPTGPSIKTTTPGVSEITVAFEFPNGLETVNNVGNRRWVQVSITISYRVHGTTTWVVRPILNTQATTSRMVLNSDTWAVPFDPTVAYDVQVEVTDITCSPGGSLTPPDVFQATTYWIELQTQKPGDPVKLFNQSIISLRILGTGQLNGPISDLTCVAQSILPEWNDTDASWVKRAGAWEYDFANNGANVQYDLPLTDLPTVPGTGLMIKATFPVQAPCTWQFAGKEFPARGPQPPDGFVPFSFEGEKYNIFAYYRASANINGILQIRIDWYSDASLLAGGAIASTLILNAGDVSTDWQSATLFGSPVPWGTKWGRLIFQVDLPTQAGSVDIFFDHCRVALISADGVTELSNVEANPSFDYPGHRTSNPAAQYRAIMQKDRQVGALEVVVGDARLDLPALENWADFCVGNNYAHDGVFDQPTSVKEALTQVCAAGFASWRVTEGVYGVVLEKLGKATKQYFSDRNISKYSWEAPFIRFADALRCRYVDQSINFETLEVIAYADGKSPNGPEAITNEIVGYAVGSVTILLQLLAPAITPGSVTIIAGSSVATDVDNGDGTGMLVGTNFFSDSVINYISGQATIHMGVAPPSGTAILASYRGYDGSTIADLYETLDLSNMKIDRLQSWVLGRFHLAVARIRTIIHSWSTDMEALTCQRGDVVYFQHFTPRFANGAARVLSVITDSGDTQYLGVTIDDRFLLRADVVQNIMFRLNDLTKLVCQIANPATDVHSDTIMFAEAIPIADVHPLPGDLVIFGDPVRLLITEIASGQTYREAVIRAVDAADWRIGDLLIPPSPPPPAPTTAIIHAVMFDAGYIMRSTDSGVTWDVISVIGGAVPGAVAHKPWLQDLVDDGVDTIVAFGDGPFYPSQPLNDPTHSAIWTSHDKGLTWSPKYGDATGSFVYAQGWIDSGFYAAGKFVIVGEDDDFGTPGTNLASGQGTAIASSDGGDTWAETSVEPADQPLGGAFGAGLFVAAVSSGKIYSSPDGIAWTLRFTSGVSGTYDPMIWTGTRFLGFIDVLFSQYTVTSTDGIAWSEAQTIGDGILGGFHYQRGYGSGAAVWDNDLGKFFAIFKDVSIPSVDAFGNPLIIGSSTDGVNWVTAFNSGYADDTSGRACISSPIVKLNGAFFVGLGDGSMATSIDGVAWTTFATNLTGVNKDGIRQLRVAGTNLICASDKLSPFNEASFYYSTDSGLTWNRAFDDVDTEFSAWRVFGQNANRTS